MEDRKPKSNTQLKDGETEAQGGQPAHPTEWELLSSNSGVQRRKPVSEPKRGVSQESEPRAGQIGGAGRPSLTFAVLLSEPSKEGRSPGTHSLQGPLG